MSKPINGKNVDQLVAAQRTTNTVTGLAACGCVGAIVAVLCAMGAALILVVLAVCVMMAIAGGAA